MSFGRHTFHFLLILPAYRVPVSKSALIQWGGVLPAMLLWTLQMKVTAPAPLGLEMMKFLDHRQQLFYQSPAAVTMMVAPLAKLLTKSSLERRRKNKRGRPSNLKVSVHTASMRTCVQTSLQRIPKTK